jgi:hypothetical protein
MPDVIGEAIGSRSHEDEHGESDGFEGGIQSDFPDFPDE